MSGGGEEDLPAFVALHGAALRASRVPARYWESLCRKLRGEVGGRGPLPGGNGAEGNPFGGKHRAGPRPGAGGARFPSGVKKRAKRLLCRGG